MVYRDPDPDITLDVSRMLEAALLLLTLPLAESMLPVLPAAPFRCSGVTNSTEAGEEERDHVGGLVGLSGGAFPTVLYNAVRRIVLSNSSSLVSILSFSS